MLKNEPIRPRSGGKNGRPFLVPTKKNLLEVERTSASLPRAKDSHFDAISAIVQFTSMSRDPRRLGCLDMRLLIAIKSRALR